MMNLSEDLRARIMEAAITELSKGKECAIQLQTLLQQPPEDGGLASLDQLILQISRSFANTISELRSGQIAATGGGDGRLSLSSDIGGKRKEAAGPSRRGRYRRRKTTDSWTTLSEMMEDGHAWRKYGQKIIQNFDHPRCYFRCTHKYQGCKATKQVQIIKQNPTLFQTTYFHQHTCKDSLHLAAQLDSDPVDCNLISFQENIVPLEDHSPNPINVPSPQSEYFTSNSTSDPWKDIFDLDPAGDHKHEWGSLSGSYGEEVVSGYFQSFDHLGEMESFSFDES
ncbi:putative WRKY transcription factor 70 [Dorcoceras hygrometricum]|uniref:Putative WRKY transcription factor 70 n=1 Tax=Dorcoceras hygrometricum TaxID=472368 RepID=A0A2Z7CC16_9LAMI|nr:putative WRKY transcription factor 70 [Dorcoceras hygrometricum]